MAAGTDEMWEWMIEASDDLAEELHLGDASFTPRSLEPIDRWVDGHGGPLPEEDVTRLGFMLARLLVETHNGGLVIIRKKDHPLDGEWAVTGFARGLANDFHLPFMISAVRIATEKHLRARQWYEQLLVEGKQSQP